MDRSNLGEQARDEFHRYRTPDPNRLFTELYNVQHLTSPHIDDVCRVTICTIQRLYSILRGEELAEGADDLTGAQLAASLGDRTRDVAYNPTVPIEKFDFIFTDECHRSIYNLWRQVLEYFDASLIGLTATPAPQTVAYFHQNRVVEYNHERAVADGVNVGYDVYRIKTKVCAAGGKVEKGFLIDHRSKASRKARQEVLADDLDYTPDEPDRSVVVPDQIRTILRVDAVGVCESDKTESRPLDRQPSVPFKTLLQRVIFPAGRDEDTLTTLAARLARIDRELEPAQRQQIVTTSGGHTPATLAGAWLRAFDPDAIAELATGKPGASPEEVAFEKMEAVRKDLIAEACAPFDKPTLRQTLETLKKETEQAIGIYTPDEVIEQGFDAAAKAKAAGLVQEFRDYLAQNQAQIDALQILYSRPYKQRLTEPMLKELEKKLRDQHAACIEDNLWNAFVAAQPAKVKSRSQAGRFADLVALIRFALEQQPVLEPFAESVTARFNKWLMAKAKAGVKFSSDQLVWLNLIREHIATSLSIELDDFDYAPFSQRGGLGKAHQLFGEQLPALIEELNEALAA